MLALVFEVNVFHDAITDFVEHFLRARLLLLLLRVAVVGFGLFLKLAVMGLGDDCVVGHVFSRVSCGFRNSMMMQHTISGWPGGAERAERATP